MKRLDACKATGMAFHKRDYNDTTIYDGTNYYLWYLDTDECVKLHFKSYYRDDEYWEVFNPQPGSNCHKVIKGTNMTQLEQACRSSTVGKAIRIEGERTYLCDVAKNIWKDDDTVMYRTVFKEYTDWIPLDSECELAAYDLTYNGYYGTGGKLEMFTELLKSTILSCKAQEIIAEEIVRLSRL